jgi:predicted HicB family RNase H-like nuclease
MKKTINISEDLHYQIKIHCAKNKLKLNTWIENELKKILKESDNNKGSYSKDNK